MKRLRIQDQITQNLTPSLAVFLVALPLCLGIAHASGVPILAGLLSGIVGGLIVGALSNSQVSVSGPAAGLTAIVLAGLQKLGAFEALLMATVMAGVIQVLMGFFKLGVVVKFIPSAVIKGMLASIGLILIVKQFPHLIGYDIEEMGVEEFSATANDLNEPLANGEVGQILPEHNTWTTLIEALSRFKLGALLIGLSAFVTIVIWEKRLGKKWPMIPSSLIAVTIGVILHLVFEAWVPDFALAGHHLVQLPVLSSPLDLLSQFQSPDWSSGLQFNVMITAVTIAIVASAESLLSLDAADRLDPQGRRADPNRELIAQGVGNTLAGILGGIPVTTVVVRTSVNVSAGAKSKASAILHGLWLLLAVLFFAKFLNLIPIAALAAVLVYTGFKLSNPAQFKSMYQKGIEQLVPFLVTITVVLFTDLLKGVAAGVITAGIFILRSSYKHSAFNISYLGRTKRIVLGEDASFLQKARLEEVLKEIPAGSTVEIDGSKSSHIDTDVIDVIERFKQEASQRGVQVVTGGIQEFKDHEELSCSMDAEYRELLANNHAWREEKLKEDSQFFSRLSEGQTPHFLVIGCSDSRVPIETVTKADPGNIFSHRNIANIVSLTDINLLSVLQYSVEVLNVRHIVVLGHYGCGGVRAALGHRSLGLIDNWISNIKFTVMHHQEELSRIIDATEYERRVIELHVHEQVQNLHKTSIVQNAIKKFGFPNLHGWVYDINSGKIKDLELDLQTNQKMVPIFRFD